MGRTPVARLTLPALYPKQREFVCSPERYTLIESGTKTGKTFGLAAWIVKSAWERPGTRWWWSAPVYIQTKIGIRRCQQLLPRETRTVTWGNLSIQLMNGSIIEGRSGEKPDNLFGEEVHGGVIDEASRYREESFHAFRSTLTFTQGRLKIIGNPKGRRNWFYRMCQKAKLDPEYAYYHLSTIDNPYIPEKEVEDAREMLPRHVFEELYMGVAQEDSTGVFSKVRDHIRGEPRGPEPGGIYIVGYDSARKKDNAVAIVMDWRTRDVVKVLMLPKATYTLQIEAVAALANMYNGALVWMDGTGPGGDKLFEDLRKIYPRVESFDYAGGRKQKLIETLAVDMEHGRIHYPANEMLLGELELFEYKLTRSGNVQYEAPPGFHDDAVNALALANWGIVHGRMPGDVGIS